MLLIDFLDEKRRKRLVEDIEKRIGYGVILDMAVVDEQSFLKVLVQEQRFTGKRYEFRVSKFSSNNDNRMFNEELERLIMHIEHDIRYKYSSGGLIMPSHDAYGYQMKTYGMASGVGSVFSPSVHPMDDSVMATSMAIMAEKSRKDIRRKKLLIS